MRWIPPWPHTRSADPPPPSPGRRDVVAAFILALFAVADIPEGVTVWEPASSISVLVAVVATYWRRRFALVVLTVAFGARFAAEVASGMAESEMQATLGHVVLLGVLVYSMGRWSSWRDFAVGIGIVSALAIGGEVLTAKQDWTQQFNDALIWGMLAATGLTVRYRDALQRMRADKIRAVERERIARDLHDVVAHHVSAIAIQAEGARAAAEANPMVAVDVLETIHATASLTLTEMRRMVAVLRDDTPSSLGENDLLAPQASIAELGSLLGDPGPPGLPVRLTLGTNLESLPSEVTAAVLRITQEAVTNARRHSHNARVIDVSIERHPDRVEIAVVDDGSRVVRSLENGYGIVGMTERCEILGGSLVAGSQHIGGWGVHAIIPLESISL